jgi:hypothetical protein
MKKIALIILCLSVFSPTVLALGHKSHKARRRAKTVTVTGCISQGVECPVLTTLDGKPRYSVTRNKKLRVGQAYRITGPLSDMGICMQGMPILNPRRIIPLKVRCPAAKATESGRLSHNNSVRKRERPSPR